MSILCKHCGLSREDHHAFEPDVPDGCVCDPFAWFDGILPICQEFIGAGDECETCSHEKECHKR